MNSVEAAQGGATPESSNVEDTPIEEKSPSQLISDLPAEPTGDEGICSDDIYTTYLKQQFRQIASKAGTPLRRDSDNQALSYARRRLIGPTTPYFGGIPIVANEQVDRWIHYFKTSGRSEFIKWLVRGETVRRMVQPILQDSGVPVEFFYLAMVESGFSNRAYSRKRATGTWQFMPATARNYGLAINHWVDERRDPVKSTIAAANYLRDLYDRLGDWYLAMAAYNAGPGKVRRAMRAARTRDFWTMARTQYLARETKSYVPKVLAAVLLASDMRTHGFDVTDRAQEWVIPETEVIVQRPIRLAELAKLLDVPLQLVKSWNPELIQGITPPGRTNYALRLAPQLAMRYQQIEHELTELKVSDVRLHTIQDGETLRGIAKRYKVGVGEIMSLNPRLKAHKLRIGHSLAVPVPSISTGTPDKA